MPILDPTACTSSTTTVPIHHLLTLTKVIRLKIIGYVVDSSIPSPTTGPASDELITEQDFERWCLHFMQSPLLHVCTHLRQEASSLIDVAMKTIIDKVDIECLCWKTAVETSKRSRRRSTDDHYGNPTLGETQKMLNQWRRYGNAARGAHSEWKSICLPIAAREPPRHFNAEPFRLLDLPKELRLEIFEYAVQSASPSCTIQSGCA